MPHQMARKSLSGSTFSSWPSSSSLTAPAARCWASSPQVQQQGFEVEIDSETGDCSSIRDDEGNFGTEESIPSSFSFSPTVPPTTMPSDERQDAIVDRLRTMLLQESSPAYATCDYLRAAAALEEENGGTNVGDNGMQGNGRAPIDRTCRAKMVRWMFQVVDHCQFSRESAAVAASHLDRFLSLTAVDCCATVANKEEEEEEEKGAFSSSLSISVARALSNRKAYQLVAITSLYLSIKTNEPIVVTPLLMSDMSQGSYGTADFCRAERDLLETLRWRTSRPTALDFARHFVALLPPSVAFEVQRRHDGQIMDLVRYQIELAVSDYELSVLRPPSDIAIAAVLNILNMVASQQDINEYLKYLYLATGGTGSLSSSGLLDPFWPKVDDIMVRLTKLMDRANAMAGSPSLLAPSPPSQWQPPCYGHTSTLGARASAATAGKAKAVTKGAQVSKSNSASLNAMSPTCVSFDEDEMPC